MLTLVLGLVIAALALVLASTLRLALSLRRRVRDLEAGGRSLRTKHGQLWEQLIPFAADYPWDPGNFRFIGSPIDGVQFEDDKVVLLEFKTGKSRLSGRQRQIQELVDQGKVEFRVMRVA